MVLTDGPRKPTNSGVPVFRQREVLNMIVTLVLQHPLSLSGPLEYCLLEDSDYIRLLDRHQS